MVNLFSPYRHGEYMKFDCKKTSIRLKRLRESKKLSHDKLSDEIEDRYGVHIDKKTLINYEKAETLSSKPDAVKGMLTIMEYQPIICLESRTVPASVKMSRSFKKRSAFPQRQPRTSSPLLNQLGRGRCHSQRERRSGIGRLFRR